MWTVHYSLRDIYKVPFVILSLDLFKFSPSHDLEISFRLSSWTRVSSGECVILAVRLLSNTILISHDSITLLIRKVLWWCKAVSKLRKNAPKGSPLSNINWDEISHERARRSLLGLIEQRPVEVYTIALRLLHDPRKTFPETIARGMEDIARSAARISLRDNLLVGETNIEKKYYAGLADYRFSCDVRLTCLLVTQEVIDKTGDDWIWHNPSCKDCPPAPKIAVEPKELPHPQTWWKNYWQVVVASIRERPCEELFKDDQTWEDAMQKLEEECLTCYGMARKKYDGFKQKIIQITTNVINDVSIHRYPSID